MPFVFTNRNGGMRWGEKNIVDTNDGIISPIVFTVNSITYAGTTQGTFSGSLSTGNEIVNATNTSGTYNVYAFGNISTAGTYVINYTYSGPSNVSAYVLAVGGGGGGGSGPGGGGGGGGVVMLPITFSPSSGTITINVGVGGTGSIANGGSNTNGGNTTVTINTTSGTPPSITSIIAYGGGYGGYGSTVANTGGSGGGQGAGNLAAVPGNTSNNNYANAGSTATTSGTSGGGAGASSTDNYTGGRGIKCSLPGIIDFSPSGYSKFGGYYWAGGGGGAGWTGGGSVSSVGGLGGGSGSTGGDTNGIAAATGGTGVNTSSGVGGANTGGGGSGANNIAGGTGGSGIAVIAFPTSSFVTSKPLNTDSSLIIWYTFESGTYTSTTLSNMATGTAVVDAVFSVGSSTQIGSTLPTIIGSSYLVENASTNIFINRTVATSIGTNGFTLAFWIYISSTTGDVIFAQVAGTANAGPGIFLEIASSTSAISLNSNSGGYGPTDPNTVNNYLNTWVHKAYTVTSGNLVSIYHNGALAASATGSKLYSAVFSNTSYLNGFMFGSGYCNQNTTTITSSASSGFVSTGGTFTGKFDDVRVYNRALTSTEVASLFNYR